MVFIEEHWRKLAPGEWVGVYARTPGTMFSLVEKCIDWPQAVEAAHRRRTQGQDGAQAKYRIQHIISEREATGAGA